MRARVLVRIWAVVVVLALLANAVALIFGDGGWLSVAAIVAMLISGWFGVWAFRQRGWL